MMKRHALFVGVNDYADPTIQDLAFPTEDATELTSVFRRLLKFDRVEKLTNPAHSPEVVDAVSDMTRGLGPGDLFLFFFAGHGFRVKDNHVLVCAKDEFVDLEDEYAGLSVGRLKKRMRGPWNRMLVLDACQNDIRTTRGADSGVAARDLGLIHALDDGVPGAGLQIVVTSCSEGQKALEVADLRHGLFTSAFLDSVTSFADSRRRIDLEALRTDLGGRMSQLISKYRLSGRQEPMFTMPADAGGIVLLDGAVLSTSTPQPPPQYHQPAAAPTLVVCPVCFGNVRLEGTHNCVKCGKKYVCADCWDMEYRCCAECARAARKDAEERSRPAGTRFVVRVGSVEVPLHWCPAGTFTMGSPSTEEGRYDTEVQHRVTLTSGFWMGETEVTQGLWKKVMGGETIHDLVRKALRDDTKYNLGGKMQTLREYWNQSRDADPSNICGGLDDDVPVYFVNWYEAAEFCARLTAMARQGGTLPEGCEFRLPTEAEWEYACRAGTTTALPNGRDIHILGERNAPALDDIAWYGGNSSVGFDGRGWDTDGWNEKQYPGGRAAPRAVGTKNPNRWGLYDMIGNVWEWCADWYGDYPTGSVSDPQGPTSDDFRVLRGGCWGNYSARRCRSADRNCLDPGDRGYDYGFRLSCSVGPRGQMGGR